MEKQVHGVAFLLWQSVPRTHRSVSPHLPHFAFRALLFMNFLSSPLCSVQSSAVELDNGVFSTNLPIRVENKPSHIISEKENITFRKPLFEI